MTFDWKSEYDIGNAQVDGQHRELFRQVAVIGELLEDGVEDEGTIDRAVSALTEYATAHFEDEEQLMVDAGVDTRHLQKQRMEHHSFMYDLGRLRTLSVDEEVSDRFGRLLSFATNWLIFHTLQTDQQLGVQLKALQSGKSPEDAFAEAQAVSFGPTIDRPVVDALIHLWSSSMETVHMLEKRLQTLEK